MLGTTRVRYLWSVAPHQSSSATRQNYTPNDTVAIREKTNEMIAATVRTWFQRSQRARTASHWREYCSAEWVLNILLEIVDYEHYGLEATEF